MDKVQITEFAAPEGARYAFEQRLESKALALCVQHSIDNEVATADTLAQLAATFDI